MSDYPRLSELAGISELEESESVGSWPLNTALVLIGAAIVAIAFYFLDPQDPRWLHNPWTYAIATPVSTLLLSILLSTFVSRIVEKSMQLAFLLSVLVHLILLIYAVNIIVFSQLWPEVLESFDRQRHQLERETLQANQYHRVSASSQSGQRPDYLRFVPTQHQPTEIEDAKAPALRLAESESNNLVSPSPKVELLVNPHLLERDRVVPAMPTASEQAASLSRSSLQHKLDASSAPEQLPTLPSEAEPTSFAPSTSATDMRRQQADDKVSVALAPGMSPPSPRDRTKTPELSRARAKDSADSKTLPRPALELPRESLAAIAPNFQPRIAVPNLESTLEPPPLTRIASGESERRRSTSAEPSISSLAAQPVLIEGRSQSVQRNLRNELPRKEAQWIAPEKSMGAAAQPIQREIAGGSVGLPAPRSMPVHGVDSLAGNVTPTPTELVAPRESLTRSQRNNRVASSMLELGAAQSQHWNGSLSLSAGVAGRSPTQLAQDNADGNAAAQDIANLTGSSGAIERSALGSNGQNSASPPQMSGVRVAELLGAEFNDAMSLPAGLDSASVEIGRSRSSTASTTLGSPLPNLPMQHDARLGSSSQPGLAPRAFPSVDGLASAAVAASSFDNPVGSSGSAPTAGQVALPTVDTNLQSFDSSAEAPSQFAPAASLTRGSRLDSSTELPASMPLEIEAAVGQGGIAPALNSVGLLLPRRNSMSADTNPLELETQRFARQDVGGPLAAGQKVALPTPAFQQRLERLQDRNPQDDTAAEPQTELAIERGLAFLAKHQRPDGSWRLQDFDTQVLMRSDTAATALSLLAFQGAGYTHKQFKYADVVDKAILFLRNHQKTNGDLYIEQDPASNQNAWLYSHGIAALALCEAYGMTQDPELKAAAQKSIDFMVASQDPQRGGWRYRPGVGTDTSVTGWFMMAFKSGQLAGLDVPAQSFDAIRIYLELSKASEAEPHLYRYNPFAPDTVQQQHGLKPTAVMTSVGLLMRLYTGWKRDRKEMQDGADFLLERLPTHGTRTNSLRDTYYWYYATQVVFHMGGERWDRWHDALYPLLIEHQVTHGEYAGSWEPMVPTPDLWARYGGRLYVTTLNLLSLEVSYRHLPLYEATAGDRL